LKRAPAGLWLDDHPVADIFSKLPYELPGLLFHDAEAGQKLLVTEAMKLETVIKAPITGTVREIVAGAGESVEAGDLLVVIEEAPAAGA